MLGWVTFLILAYGAPYHYGPPNQSGDLQVNHIFSLNHAGTNEWG